MYHTDYLNEQTRHQKEHVEGIGMESVFQVPCSLTCSLRLPLFVSKASDPSAQHTNVLTAGVHRRR